MHPDRSPQVLVVTGLSGAGRSTASKCLEDLGWYVVDNLPPQLIGTLADLAQRGEVGRIAVVTDVRSQRFSSDLRAAIDALRHRGIDVRVLFLDAADAALVARFESVRRPHPLATDARLEAGIAIERELMSDLRAEADLIIDTTDLNVHQLRSRIVAAFGESGDADALTITLVSFGYKYGTPTDADIVIDCRFLDNPHWVPELRPLTGLDEPVREHVMGQPGAVEFCDRFADLLGLMADGYRSEGKHFVTVAIGCTGGRHRSVAIVREIADRLGPVGAHVTVDHRDVDR